WTGGTSTARKYYYAGAQRVAMRPGTGSITFLLGDHLGSTSKTADASGNLLGQVLYYPFGDTRVVNGSTATTFRYTGQRQQSEIGLYFYGARWYDSGIGRFAAPDTVVPEAGNPQSFNRYSYSLSNPIKYTDPTGHRPEQDGQPPVTIDEEHGLCINVWNIGCSGTIKSNRDLIKRSYSSLPGDLRNPKDWIALSDSLGSASVALTDAALVFSGAGAAMETVGFTLGSEAGPVGSIFGGIIGNAVHQVSTNLIESALSTLSTGAQVMSDAISRKNRVTINEQGINIALSDASFTAGFLQGVGNANQLGIADAAIDYYASAYNHGRDFIPGQPAQSVPALLGLSGYTYSWGPLSISFGN
ncbi:MAG: RHS repeat-associated core domain-containing protein, partial [Anaerolineales bacterium]|nr:RHS repeat-associated core domain-containing protein [Anaerolineales bacterium]